MYNPRKDPALFGVLLSNIFSIVMAYIYGWNLLEVLWIYWAQSVIIGVINHRRILSLENFSTENFKINGQSVSSTKLVKHSVATFFAIHFGIFHFVYLMFLLAGIPDMMDNTEFSFSLPDGVFIMMCIAAFAASHIFSFRHHGAADFKQKKPNIGTLMFYPYMRIVPMHLTIIFGFMFPVTAMILFMTLKTFADIGMHIIEHRLFQKSD